MMDPPEAVHPPHAPLFPIGAGPGIASGRFVPPIPIAMNRHVPTLSILHYAYGTFICLGGFFMFALIMLGVLFQSDMMLNESDTPPAWLGALLQALGWVLFVVIELWGVLVILSGRWIKRRIHRTASLVIGGLCLLSFPLGTALGVFTLITLLNTDVEAQYSGGSTAA